MGTGQRSIAAIPSGVPVGGIGRDLAATLEAHFGYGPLHATPVIEEGTYDDFKACVFRVCSMMAFKVTMDELGKDLFREGLRVLAVNTEQRQWAYCYIDAWKGMVTVVEITMEFMPSEQIDFRTILDSLGAHYGFIYDRLEVVRTRQSPDMQGYERRAGFDYQAWDTSKLKARLLFRNWS